ncbi:MAG: hypothetical protein ACLPVY_10985 [Acidimicrobiia bacterium]
MGSKGAKRRKPAHSKHLPKVGSATENERLLHDEQHAVLDQMGVGHAGRGVKSVVAVVAIVLVGCAVVGLMAVMVFR